MFSLPHIQYCFENLSSQMSVGLLLYSHIPTALVALFFGGFLFFKTKNILGTTFFATCIFFALWCFFDLVSWYTFFSHTTMFSWSLEDLFALIFFLFSYYFIYSFITKRDLPKWQKLSSLILILPTIVWTFLGSNLSFYDGNTCTVIENSWIVSYPYFVEAVFIIATIFLIVSYHKKNTKEGRGRESLLSAIGVIAFLSFFFSATLLVKFLISDNMSYYAYNYEIYGLFGMPLLLIFLVYTVVKFKSFNIKMIGAQALVFALIIIIGAEFFFIQTNINRVLTAITLVITAVIGVNLIRSVKKEVKQKEDIEKLAQKLEVTNTGLEAANEKLKELDVLKSEFVSLATHQIRAPLSAIKGYLSEVFEGDFGPYSKELEKPLQVVFQSTENLVNIVADFLNISRIEGGKMKYELAPVDLKTVVDEVVKELKPNLDRVGLELKVNIPNGHYVVYADMGKVKQVIGNLIDNAMKYTPKGSITLSLTADEKAQKIRFSVSDTGIGIPAEVIPKLFQKFSRAKNANEVNIIGTGLGLYVAKLMIEGQSGRIWAESPGAGKGSTFSMELPIAHVS